MLRAMKQIADLKEAQSIYTCIYIYNMHTYRPCRDDLNTGWPFSGFEGTTCMLGLE